MPYRVARVAGDSTRLVIHPIRGAGTHLVVGLAGAAASIGGVLAWGHPLAGVVVMLASGAFGGWIGTEAYVTRVELVRDERENRLTVRWRAVGNNRETTLALDAVTGVLVEKNAAKFVRLVLELATRERVDLTPYFAASDVVEEGATTVREFLGLDQRT